MNRHVSSRWPLLLILVLTASGAWISGELVKQHANVWRHADSRPAGLFGRICVATAGVGLDCDSVAKGAWAELNVPLPAISRDLALSVQRTAVPVAFLGLAYFVFLGVWFLLIGPPRPHGYQWHWIPLGVGLAGAAVSVPLLALMALGFAPWCGWCLLVHGINLLTVVAIWRLNASGPHRTDDIFSAGSAQHTARLTLTPREVTRTLACATVAIAGLWVYRSEHLALHEQLDKALPYRDLVMSLQKDPKFLVREHLAQPQWDIPLRPNESVAEGRPELVIFTDFECSACYCTSRWMREWACEALGGQITVRVRHFPLCSQCNQRVTGEYHPHACAAAYAVEAAGIVGGETALWRMHDLLHMRHKTLDAASYDEFAAEIGLAPDEFRAALEGQTVRDVVAADVALAGELGVNGTPALFLNGRRITRLCQVPAFWMAFAEVSVSSDKDGRVATIEAPREATRAGRKASSAEQTW